MTKPTIVTVDDDPMVSAALTRDLRARYASAYSVRRGRLRRRGPRPCSPPARAAGPAGGPDHRGPADAGHDRHRAARAGARARADRQAAASHCVRRHRRSPSRRSTTSGSTTTCSSRGTRRQSGSTRSIDDLLGDWLQANPDHSADVRVVGHRWSERSHEVKTFLARNHVPYRWYDVERDAEALRLQAIAEAPARGPPARPRAGRRGAARADEPGPRRRAGPADPGRPAALRRLHRRGRSGRPGCRGVRGFRGAAAP